MSIRETVKRLKEDDARTAEEWEQLKVELDELQDEFDRKTIRIGVGIIFGMFAPKLEVLDLGDYRGYDPVGREFYEVVPFPIRWEKAEPSRHSLDYLYWGATQILRGKM